MERDVCPQCHGTTEGTGRIITNKGTKQCPDPFHGQVVEEEEKLPLEGMPPKRLELE